MSADALICELCLNQFDTVYAFLGHPCALDLSQQACTWCRKPMVMSPWWRICSTCDAPQAGEDLPRIAHHPTGPRLIEGESDG